MKEKSKGNIYKNVAISVLCIAIGVVISFQYKTIFSSRSEEDAQNQNLENVKLQLIQAESERQQLRDENATLKARIDEIDKLPISEQMKAIAEERDKAQMAAGLKDVKGKGVEIIIAANPSIQISTVEMNLLKLINVLRSADVQAISIGGQRITSMTEIIAAENYIVINGNMVIAPYNVLAIGNQDRIESAFYMTGGIFDLLSMGDVQPPEFKRLDSIVIPALPVNSPKGKTDLLSPA